MSLFFSPPRPPRFLFPRQPAKARLSSLTLTPKKRFPITSRDRSFVPLLIPRHPPPSWWFPFLWDALEYLPSSPKIAQTIFSLFSSFFFFADSPFFLFSLSATRECGRLSPETCPRRVGTVLSPTSYGCERSFRFFLYVMYPFFQKNPTRASSPLPFRVSPPPFCELAGAEVVHLMAFLPPIGAGLRKRSPPAKRF